MASLWRHPNSSFWTACWRDRSGRQVKRSTKSKDRKEAQRLADEWETLAHGQHPTVRQAMAVVSAIYERATAESMPAVTIDRYISVWLGERGPAVKPSTLAFYKASIEKFRVWLAERSTQPLHTITRQHITEYRNHLAESLAAKTVNHDLKCVKMLFRAARKDGVITEDPAEFVSIVKNRGATTARRSFTQEELRAVVNAAPDEWKSMIRFGLYTGMRLGDVATLRWSNVDLHRGELRIQTAKTGKPVVLPLAGPLLRHVTSLPAPSDPSQPIHRSACETVLSQGKSGSLSNQFARILAKAGLRVEKPHRKGERGSKSRREMSELSFHSLRHTAISIMRNAGVSAATTMAVAGHDSEQMSLHYTHVDRDSLVRAAEAFSEI